MKTIAILLSAGLAAALAGAAAPPQDVRVEITSKGFMPVILELNVDQKVIWLNSTTADHTVTERGKRPGLPQDEKDRPLFDSGKIKPGSTFEFTFTRPGTYLYGCTLDPSMAGKIIVKPKP